jgi:hypothetical protein
MLRTSIRKGWISVKKLIGLLLCVAMVFTLSLGSVGCGGKDKEGKKDVTGTDAKDKDKDKDKEKKKDS